jgi:hypothetical protein
MRPARLNTTTASLFVLGSACFVVGSLPTYADAVGEVADGVTYFIGSLFFTSASFLQVLQAQTPAMMGVVPAPVALWRPLPHDRGWLSAITQFAGTLAFNVSTLAALARNASVRQEDRYVWRPDAVGSTFFLVASVFGILAIGVFWSWQPRSLPWLVAWLNLIGSVLFMISALAAYVLPASGEVLAGRVVVAGTLFGALCFLAGSALMVPAWRRAVRPA